MSLEYRADVGSDPKPVDWDTFLRTAPNQLVPTMGDILTEPSTPPSATTWSNTRSTS